MRFSALCKVRLEVVKSLIENQEHLLATYQSSLVQDRAAMYVLALKEAGLTLNNCIGLIDCTRMQMC